MKRLTRIYIVRHGHVHNPNDVFYGRSRRFRLSDDGVLQAEAAAQYLKKEHLAVCRRDT